MPAGRPRIFDIDTALEAALNLFWQHGYEGTSLAMLTAAMGVNTPSLYAAFGNKEALFQKALERYMEVPASYLKDALHEPTAHGVAEKVLEGAIRLATNPRHPARGCFLVRGALATGPTNDSISQALHEMRSKGENALQRRFERAIAAGDLPISANATQLARYLITMIWGLSVQAAGGASRQAMEEVAQVVLASWPTKE